MTGKGGRPLVIAWHASETATSFKARYRAETRADVRQRWHALWLLRSGWRARHVAEVLGVHEDTVQRWVRWYRQGGTAVVESPRPTRRGKPSLLSPKEQATLVAEVATGRFRSVSTVRQWVAEQFGVTYSLSGMYSLLARLRRTTTPHPDTDERAGSIEAVRPVDSEEWLTGDGHSRERVLGLAR